MPLSLAGATHCNNAVIIVELLLMPLLMQTTILGFPECLGPLSFSSEYFLICLPPSLSCSHLLCLVNSRLRNLIANLQKSVYKQLVVKIFRVFQEDRLQVTNLGWLTKTERALTWTYLSDVCLLESAQLGSQDPIQMLTETSKLLLAEGVPLSGIYKNFKGFIQSFLVYCQSTQLSTLAIYQNNTALAFRIVQLRV